MEEHYDGACEKCICKTHHNEILKANTNLVMEEYDLETHISNMKYKIKIATEIMESKDENKSVQLANGYGHFEYLEHIRNKLTRCYKMQGPYEPNKYNGGSHAYKFFVDKYKKKICNLITTKLANKIVMYVPVDVLAIMITEFI